MKVAALESSLLERHGQALERLPLEKEGSSLEMDY
jgi:hypothetical protein